MTETRETKVSRKGVVIALGIICIVLIAGLGGTIAVYTSMINDKNNTISSLDTKISELNSNVTNLQKQITSDNATINSLTSNVTNLQKLLNATSVSVGEITANLSAWVDRAVVVEGNISYIGLSLLDWNYELSSNGATIGVSWQFPLNSPPDSLGPVILANASDSYNGKNVLVLGIVEGAAWSGGMTFVNGTVATITMNNSNVVVCFIEAERIVVI
jgi:cell division protein FtsL